MCLYKKYATEACIWDQTWDLIVLGNGSTFSAKDQIEFCYNTKICQTTTDTVA